MSKPFLVIKGKSQVEQIVGERRHFRLGGAQRDKRNEYKRKPKHAGKGWE